MYMHMYICVGSTAEVQHPDGRAGPRVNVYRDLLYCTRL